MGPREGRLKAMLANDGMASWGLNDEDRDAIRWAFDRISTLERELDESRQWRRQEMQKNINIRSEIRRAIDGLNSVIA